MNFQEYLILEKRGRKVLSATRDDDANFIRKHFNYDNQANMTNTIKNLRQKYLKALERNNIKLLKAEEKNLAELKQLIDKNKITLPKRQRNWFIHEKDLVDGINELFKSGFFKVKNGKETIELKDNKKFFAEQVGGSSQSDVRVVNSSSGKNFFIECKLNLETAEYFKFGVKIIGNKLNYDHKKFLQGDVKHNKEQFDRINELFTKDINLSEFLNNLMQNDQVKDYWNQFLDNLNSVRKSIKTNDEFKEFSKEQIRNVFPDGFTDLTQIFDDYCAYYIDKYNELIDQIFDLLLYDLPDKRNEYKISRRSASTEISDNVVFKTIDLLIANIKIYEEKQQDKIVSNKEEFNRLVNEIKLIEVKISALLKDQGLNPTDFNSIDQIKNINKMMYFFKLFLSSTGRKTKNGIALLNAEHDEFGNMMLCPEIQIESDVLAKMITDFYVKKDHCAYIQIADTVFQFDENFNPLNIPKLPLFKNAATIFNIKFLVDDDISRISLHINAFQINTKALKGCNKISFKKNDANYIKTKLKKIEIKLT